MGVVLRPKSQGYATLAQARVHSTLGCFRAIPLGLERRSNRTEQDWLPATALDDRIALRLEALALRLR